MQTDAHGKDSTLSFRCSVATVYLVRAAAARNGVLVSDWLREATETAVRRELVDFREQEHTGNPEAAGF